MKGSEEREEDGEAEISYRNQIFEREKIVEMRGLISDKINQIDSENSQSLVNGSTIFRDMVVFYRKF